MFGFEWPEFTTKQKVGAAVAVGTAAVCIYDWVSVQPQMQGVYDNQYDAAYHQQCPGGTTMASSSYNYEVVSRLFNTVTSWVVPVDLALMGVGFGVGYLSQKGESVARRLNVRGVATAAACSVASFVNYTIQASSAMTTGDTTIGQTDGKKNAVATDCGKTNAIAFPGKYTHKAEVGGVLAGFLLVKPAAFFFGGVKAGAELARSRSGVDLDAGAGDYTPIP